MSHEARLYFEHSEGESEEFFLDKGSIIIGRDSPADIMLLYAQVSRRHARIDYLDGGYTIVDLGSTNGTFVNNAVVGPNPVPLEFGDEIEVGGIITLYFNRPAAVPHTHSIGSLNGVWIDPDNATVLVDALPVTPPLSGNEFDLLQLLYDANGGVVTRDEIIAKVWPDYDPIGISDEAVNGLIKRLRHRLYKTQPNREYVEVLPGLDLRIVQPG